jgi:rhodanese-related sulfurtransferase
MPGMSTHRFWRRTIAIMATCLVLAGHAAAVEYTRDSLNKVRKNLADGKAVLIDVRELGEWKQGHLADAKLVPLSELRKMSQDAQVRDSIVERLPQDKIIYCHCASGVRVITATQLLDKQGYKIRPLKAGYKELLEVGFPRAEQP